jgi:ribosome-binding protein aMBF1 (putative translation factor)
VSGHHKFSRLTEDFSEERRAEISQRTVQLKAKMALGELRQALQLSQAELATSLQVKQPAISRLEQRTDMYVSHLRKVIEAMGGELDIIARFPEGEVRIDNFSGMGDSSVMCE